MIACPNCGKPTTTRTLPAWGDPEEVAVEACAACSLLWFDRSSSISLKPRSVIELFRFIGAAMHQSAHVPLKPAFTCPRCAGPLGFTHDLQRSTRFVHWRCAIDLGQLITFHQFLRQKNFIRTPTAAELAKLRETVRMIQCSQCGAPVNLETDAACRHCGAAVALIDPDGISRALGEYAAAASRQPDPAALRDALAQAAVQAIAVDHQLGAALADGAVDPVAAGASALEAWFAQLLKDA